jgi:phenylalanyl-tRNA synthetase alpha subunit
MYRSTLTAIVMTGLLAFGCEQKTEGEKAAENTADQAVKKLEEAKEKAQDGTSEAKKMADKNADAAANQGDAAAKSAENAADAAKDGAGNVQSEINSLVSKAKDAIKEAKWTDAEAHVQQIDTLKAKLPEGARKPIDDMLAEVRTMIQKGKAMPAMPH